MHDEISLPSMSFLGYLSTDADISEYVCIIIYYICIDYLKLFVGNKYGTRVINSYKHSLLWWKFCGAFDLSYGKKYRNVLSL